MAFAAFAALAALAATVAPAPASAKDNPRVAAVDYRAASYVEEATRERLARFDLVVLGFWRAYGDAKLRSVVLDLRKRHPGILLGQYTAINEVQGSAGPNEAATDLVRKIDAANWWLRDARGGRVQWTSRYNNFELNLGPWAPPDEDGLRWPQWKARRDVDQVFSHWPGLDFVFIDNVFEKPRVRAVWRTGGDEQDPASAAPLARQGYVDYVKQLRDLMPDMRVMGNVDNDLSSPEYRGVFDGAFLEAAIGRNYSLETWRGWPALMARYRSVSRSVKDPRLVVFHVTGRADDYQAMRYGLASCLMGDGTFAYAGADDGSTPWFDEFGVELGRALEPAHAASGSAWMRRFARGIAIVNPGPGPAIVEVPPGFAHLAGTQDPQVNDGKPAREVTLRPRDGILLVREDR